VTDDCNIETEEIMEAKVDSIIIKKKTIIFDD
jgi:hypothetical protein